jgi:hypothetical protein
MTSRARSTVTRGGARWSAGALGAVVAALATVAAGCGDSGTSADPADDFVGTWLYNDFQSSEQCPGNMLNTPPNPNKTFAHGVSAALVDLSESPLLPGVFCDFTFDVNGPIATAHPGQTCALTPLDSVSIDQPDPNAPPLWTFTLNSASTASEVVQATVHFDINNALTTCTWNMVAHLTRVSKD